MVDAGPDRAGAWTGTWWLSTRWLRRRWLAVVPVALIMAAGTAGVAIAMSTADRTANAYPDYLQRAAVGDVVINPTISTREIDEVIRALPGVTAVTSDTVLTTTFDIHPRTRAEVESAGFETFAHGSTDGKYTAMDRPVVIAGRMPATRNEVVVTPEAMQARGLGIGDEMTIAFWQSGVPDTSFGLPQEYFEEVLEPIGVEEVDIVGIVRLPRQVLPDDLYPRGDMIASPELTADYDCLPSTPSPGSGYLDVVATLLPADCALTYRYYSLSFEDGAAGVKPALDEFVRRSTELNGALSDISDMDDYGGPEATPSYFLVPTETALEAGRVERASEPIVTALVVLGSASAAVTLVLLGLAASRELRRTETDQQQWRELAVGRTARTLVIAIPPLLAVVVGVPVGALTAHLLAPGAIGQAGAVEGGGRRVLDLPIVGTAAALSVLAFVVVVAIAHRATGRVRSATDATTTTRAGRSVPATIGSPPVVQGLRAAIGPRAATPVIGGSALIGGALVAAVVFGSSLTALVSTPAAYGWPWDLAAMTGFGYGDLDVDGTRRLLDDDPDVEDWTLYGFLNEIALDGEPLTTLVALESTGELGLALRSGSMPDEADEVAIGASTAAERGLGVGDTVDIGGFFPSTSATVSGIVVFPSLGPFAADRVGVGTGMLIPEELVRDVVERTPELGDPLGIATFVGIELAAGASADARARLGESLGPLDFGGRPAISYRDPVRPPELVDLSTTRTVTTIVSAVLAVVAIVGLGFASWASARARRRELAVLRTLGFTDRQVRRSVRTQSMATVVLAVVLGAPIGVVVGRVLWRQFADRLGVVPDPAWAWGPLGLVVGGALVVAVLVALAPAFVATRERPAVGLRAE